MKATEYLYGIQPNVLIGMNYVNALSFKVSSGKLVLDALRKHAGQCLDNPEEYGPILDRYLAVDKAIRFNNELLRELEE